MKIPGWKDADSNWEIGGGLTSSLDKTSSKWFDESRKQRGGRNSLRAMEQQIVGCQKLYFLHAPPPPHRFQNVNPSRSNFRVPSTRFISANYSLEVAAPRLFPSTSF